MKQIVLTLFMYSSLAAIAQDTVISDANAEKRTLTSSFSAITVSDGIDLYLSQGNEESLSVSASDEKYLERFRTTVENGTLKLSYDSKGISLGINGKKKLKAYVSFKELVKINASGGADVVAKTNINVPVLSMKFSSGSHFSGEVNIKELTVEQSSGSGLTISGKSENIKVEGSSGSIFKGYDLVTDYCNAKASSGAGVHITINKELNAKANSGGGIRYKGNALIKDIIVNSGGIVKKA